MANKNNTICTCILRLSIFVGLLSVVVTIIYYTPIPDFEESKRVSCDRECHELEWPQICRYKIVLEALNIRRNNLNCLHNQTNSNDLYCRSSINKIITANRQHPGPSIHVCQNDVLVVDIINKIPGHSLSVHWRGQLQKETPVMDGAPMVTQCSILPFTTFQYKFRASEAGTHWWQVLSGDELTEKLFGVFIVKQSKRREPHSTLYDHDLNNLLIEQISSGNIYEMRVNGNTSNTSISLKTNGRYRFRVINFGGDLKCPVYIKFNQHHLTIISIDGNPVVPKIVDSIIIKSDETLDFIVTTSEGKGIYYMVMKSTSHCLNMDLNHIITVYYNSSLNAIIEDIKNPIHIKEDLSEPNLITSSLKPLPYKLSTPNVDNIVYLGFSTVRQNLGTLWSKPAFNNISMILPSQPLLLNHPEDLEICNIGNLPKRCSISFCECTHIIDIQFGSSVEIVIFDAEHTNDQKKAPHSFHLHGYHFYEVGEKSEIYLNLIDQIRKLDNDGKLLNRNLNNPVLKNSVSVPFAGVSAIRFLADNPGYWLLRSEKTLEWSDGLSLIIKVTSPSGSYPSVPKDIPTCGNFIGPDFFLA
ncbi:uncharacterized protein LOC126901979 [Daktulosphaira vitifoliae]|uniref:uncharacterized protein LOC126901979 n=1 Tax=Daktulosphaira vitifoliae TaxID=58002 RepID=UPI0021AA11C0|nr:uncharacterized protein LOC126901979 [Daktulosphaira vitifoliae]